MRNCLKEFIKKKLQKNIYSSPSFPIEINRLSSNFSRGDIDFENNTKK